jgi:hypothetical protein
MLYQRSLPRLLPNGGPSGGLSAQGAAFGPPRQGYSGSQVGSQRKQKGINHERSSQRGRAGSDRGVPRRNGGYARLRCGTARNARVHLRSGHRGAHLCHHDYRHDHRGAVYDPGAADGATVPTSTTFGGFTGLQICDLLFGEANYTEISLENVTLTERATTTTTSQGHGLHGEIFDTSTTISNSLTNAATGGLDCSGPGIGE